MGKRTRTKALRDDYLKGELKGDLAACEKFGLSQRFVNQNTAPRYRGVLLRYQQFLGQNPPSLASKGEYLGLLRKSGFDPSTLPIYAITNGVTRNSSSALRFLRSQSNVFHGKQYQTN